MTADLVIRGNLATHDGVFEGISIAIRDGKVLALGEASTMPPSAEMVDVGSRYILPGVVDPHVHSLGDKHEGFYHSTSAAAAGGTTTINDHPLDLGGAPTSRKDIETKAEKATQEAVVDFSMFASGRPEAIADVADVADCGITGYKVLMHATSGASSYNLRAVNDAELYELFEQIAQVDQTVMIHAENDPIQQFLEARLIRQGKTHLSAHNESRPEMLETAAAYTAIEVARLLHCRLHIVHGTTPQMFRRVRRARRQGMHISAETCPHYLVFNEDKWQDIGAQYKINPPLRCEATRQELWKLLQTGMIDMVTTDHAPHPENHLENVFENFSGSPGVETNLLVMFSEGVAKGRIGVDDLVRLLSLNTSKLLGIYPQKGTLAVGSDADMVVFDPQTKWTITADQLHMQAGWTMYEGLPVTGKVCSTYVRGIKVYDQGQVIGSKGHGKWVKKTRNYDFLRS